MSSVNNKLLSRSDFFKRTLILTSILFFLLAGVNNSAKAQSFSEGFDNILTLPTSGWVMVNNSVPPGTTGWSQGNPVRFPSQMGAPNSYIAADFNNTSGTGTIDNWLMTPPIFLTNGSVFKFWTRTISGSKYPDRLQVRLSTSGASTNTIDFTRLLTVINPNLEVGGYPEVWTEFTITVSGLPICPGSGVQGRLAFRYFMPNAGPTGDNANYIGIDTFSYTAVLPGIISPFEAPLDYNCDGKTDYVVARNTGGGSGGQVTWYINDGTNYAQTLWGISTDYFVSGDFDGDDKADITVYRQQFPNSFFYTLRSSNGTFIAQQFGKPFDDPTVVGDYDGDDIDDYAVYRTGESQGQKSFWYYLGSATPGGEISYVEWGQFGDYPIPGDFDGDRKNDFCIQRNNGNGEGVFYLNKSAGGFEAVFWGTPSDFVVPGDYDGDGRTDFAVVRASGGRILWSVLGRNNYNIIHLGEAWGLSATDFPVQGDYDGDGKIDLAVWRPGTAASPPAYFYVRKSTNGALIAFQWGQLGDYPVANFNGH